MGAIKQFLCELLFSCTLAGTPAPAVDELTYGTVLFDYFQEQHEAAMLHALVAETQQRRGEDPTRFDLAVGSFAFEQGMHRYATDIFAQVAQEDITKLDRLRLSFHMAREFHRRQDWDSLSEQLQPLLDAPSPQVAGHPEVAFMGSELATMRGDFEVAAALLNRVPVESELRAYGMFNLGVAYRDVGLMPEAQRQFSELANLRATSAETYDLAQRAKLALAYIARDQQQVRSAESVLQSLPASGRYQEVAMAAFGRLAMQREDYELAARIWMTLQQKDYWSPSRTSARLGFPLSLQHMARDGASTMQMALRQYQDAERSFEARLVNLASLEAAAQDPAWIRELLHAFSTDQQDPEQLQAVMLNWQTQFSHTDWLDWLAQDDVNQALEHWRELGDMQGWLGGLPERLFALEEVAIEQARRSQEAKQLLVGDGLLERRDALAQQADALAGQIQWLQTSQPQPEGEWMRPLAEADELALLDELDGMQTLLVHMSEHDRSKWSARIDRLRGVVFFRLVDEHAVRLQQLRSAHNEISATLADLDARIGRVQSAEQNFTAGVGSDFSAFLSRADEIAQAVAAARNDREAMLTAQIRARLQQESEQLQRYLLATRVAIAQATDQLASGTSAPLPEDGQW